MVTRLCLLAVAAAVCSAAAEAGNRKIEIAYSLLEQEDYPAASSLKDGLDTGDGFRVRLRPSQECYVYLVAQRDAEDFRLLLPDRRTQRGRNRLAKGKDFTWPQEGWLRLDDDRGVERLYLIVSDRQVAELEARYALRQLALPELAIVEIRDRYQGSNAYRRRVNDERVKVRFKSRDGEAALLIEEIVFRHR